MRHSGFIRLFTTIGIPASTEAGQPAPKAAHRFKMKSTGKLTLQMNGRDFGVTADSVVHYTWKTEGKERVLLLSSMAAKAAVGGQELLKMSMSRST